MKLLSFASLIVFFLAVPIPSHAEQETWKIGLLLCLTGACAESGENSRKGIDLAIEEINASGGVLGKRIEYVLENTDEGGASGAGAVTAFKKLSTNPNLKYFIGPSWTPGGLSVAPLAAARPDIIITSPTLGVAEFSRAGDNVFNLWPQDENASRFLARYAWDQGWKRVAIFSSQQPWELLQGNTFESAFIQLGGEIVSKQEPLPTTTELMTETLKVRQSKPDAVFLSNYTQMGLASKLLRSNGYTGPLFAIHMDDTRLKLSEGALEGATYAGYPEPEAGFVKRFEAKYNEAPGIGVDTSYDVVKLYAWAIEKSKSFDVKIVQKTLLGAEFPGASGLIKFDEFGGVKKDAVLYKIQDGKKTRA